MAAEAHDGSNRAAASMASVRALPRTRPGIARTYASRFRAVKAFIPGKGHTVTLRPVTTLQMSDGFLGHGRSPFPPIAHYGFLSDCESCALVAPSGAIEWLCLPRF